jgi:hypothetical protein
LSNSPPGGSAGIGTCSKRKFSGFGGPLGRDAKTICRTIGWLITSSPMQHDPEKALPRT